MFSIRIPYRCISVANKEGEITKEIILKSKTKKTIMKEYKKMGTVINFNRGFITIPIAETEINEDVFKRAYEVLKDKE